MEIFRFDRAEKTIDYHGSVGLVATRIAAGHGEVTVTCLTVRPGGTIGRHPSTGPQLFLVVAGEGWVAGEDDERIPITSGFGVRWEPGEMHSSGSAQGFTAISIEGAPLTLFEPEPNQSVA
jgi:quercetin dioxygenase-like cupin family protein